MAVGATSQPPSLLQLSKSAESCWMLWYVVTLRHDVWHELWAPLVGCAERCVEDDGADCGLGGTAD